MSREIKKLSVHIGGAFAVPEATAQSSVGRASPTPSTVGTKYPCRCSQCFTGSRALDRFSLISCERRNVHSYHSGTIIPLSFLKEGKRGHTCCI